jgi:NTP pyrophosphatase (non-canonical NTP hydrolase)
MNLQKLIQIAKSYEDALQEHTIIDHDAIPHTHVDICSHLHAEVTELFNVIRKKKAEHEGMTYEEGIIDELQDILCIWSLAVNLLAPKADTDAMIRNCAEMFKIVAKKKKGVELEGSQAPTVVAATESAIPWEPSVTQVAGLKKKMLLSDHDKGVATYFQFENEVQYPSFVLNGSARYFVLDGSIKMCGQEHPKGTFMHCEDGTTIDPFPTKAPCNVLCIYEKTNYRK